MSSDITSLDMDDVTWIEFQKRLSSLMDSFYVLLPEDKPQAIASVRESIVQMQSAVKQQLCSDAMRTVAAMAESLIQETYGIQPYNKPSTSSTDFNNGMSSPDAIMFPQLDPSANDTNDILTSALYESLKTVNGGGPGEYGSPLHSTATVSSYSDILNNLNSSSTPIQHHNHNPPSLDFRDVQNDTNETINWTTENETTTTTPTTIVINRTNDVVQTTKSYPSPVAFQICAESERPPTTILPLPIADQRATTKSVGKLLTCSLCSFKTKHRQNLHRHVKLHKASASSSPSALGIRQFSCDKCEKSFKTASSLQEHDAYVHSARKTFKCPQCEKHFAKQKDVNRHIKSHNEERSFLCHCGKSYKSKFHLNRHVLSSHAK